MRRITKIMRLSNEAANVDTPPPNADQSVVSVSNENVEVLDYDSEGISCLLTETIEENEASTGSSEEEFFDHKIATPQLNRLCESQRRRSQRPPDMQEVTAIMERASTTLNILLSKSAEDDCDLFAKLMASKLRKIPEQEREDIMLEVHRLVYDRIRSYRLSNMVI